MPEGAIDHRVETLGAGRERQVTRADELLAVLVDEVVADRDPERAADLRRHGEPDGLPVGV